MPERPADGNPGADATAAQAEWKAAEQAWKDAHPIAGRQAGWRQQMLADVAAALGRQRPARPSRLPAGHPLTVLLEEWRHRDRHLWDYAARERAQVLRRRDDAYRCAAKWLTAQASAIVIDDTSLPAGKRAPGTAREGRHAARQARLLHQAAPGILRAAVQAAAARRGIPVTAAAHGSEQERKPAGRRDAGASDREAAARRTEDEEDGRASRQPRARPVPLPWP